MDRNSAQTEETKPFVQGRQETEKENSQTQTSCALLWRSKEISERGNQNEGKVREMQPKLA